MQTNTFPYKQRVVIESPYSGDVDTHVEYARRCVKDSLLRGEAPIASHLLFTQEGILDDNIPSERMEGMTAGHAWIPICDKVVFYIDYGMSAGMHDTVDLLRVLSRPVEMRKIGKNPG